MTHLTDQQIEDVLAGQCRCGDLCQCDHCRERLEQHTRTRKQLQAAFVDVKPDREFTRCLCARIDEAQRKNEHRPKVLRLTRWIVPLVSAAAAVAVAIPLLLNLATPKPAMAAELAQLHEHNLTHQQYAGTEDPAELADYLRGHLGFTPAVPKLGAGMSMRGCCVDHFHNKPVGSYVVDTPAGPISVIVLDRSQDELGIDRTMTRHGRRYGLDSYADCRLAATTLHGYTYCAVGEVSYEYLAELLAQLVRPENRQLSCRSNCCD